MIAIKNKLKMFICAFFRVYYFCCRLFKRALIAKSWQQADRIMICTASGIGDTIMALPVITVLKKVKPQCSIGVTCRYPNQMLFSDMDITTLVWYTMEENQLLSFYRMIRKIRRFSPQIWIAMRPSNTMFQSMLAIFSGAMVSVRHSFPSNKQGIDFGFIYTRIYPLKPYQHQIQNNLNLLKIFEPSISSEPFIPKVKIDKKSSLPNLQLGYSELRHVCIHAGGNQHNKRYPAHLFARVILYLIAREYKVLLLGGRSDREINGNIAKMVNDVKCIDKSGQLLLNETAYILQQSHCLIANDSGIMHLADAMNVPLIALFGPTNPAHVGPVKTDFRIMQSTGGIGDIKVMDVINCFDDLMSMTKNQSRLKFKNTHTICH